VQSISRKPTTLGGDPQRLYAKLQPFSLKELDDDIVRALWRHRELHEQGMGRGTCPWIIPYTKKGDGS